MQKTISLILALSFLLILFTSCKRITLPPKDSDSPVADTDVVTEERYVPLYESKKEVISEEGFYLSGSNNYVTSEMVKKYPQITNLPTLYINIDPSIGLSGIQHGVYSQATYTLVDNHVIDSYYEKNMEIKGRGNWSWAFPQKPYTIKLADEADFLGMGEAKKWVLVTVHSDKTMMHNYMTQKLAKIMGLNGICDNRYVDVVCNGKYVGTYVLTEKIELHKNRLDLGENSGSLFEIEMVYRHSCKNCIIMYNDPNDPSKSIHMRLLEYGNWDLDALTKYQSHLFPQRMAAIQEHVDMISQAMQEGDMETLEEVLDIDSFVNWYLLNEFTRNYDSAFVTSCYCYFDENGILCMGPVWDYDTCYGIQDSNYDTAHVANVPWFNWLLNNCEEFKTLVCERWTELRQSTGVIEDFYRAIDSVTDYIKASEILQHTVYPDSELLNVPFDEAVLFFKTWVFNRVTWMDEQFLTDTEGVFDFSEEDSEEKSDITS